MIFCPVCSEKLETRTYSWFFQLKELVEVFPKEQDKKTRSIKVIFCPVCSEKLETRTYSWFFQLKELVEVSEGAGQKNPFNKGDFLSGML